MRTVSEQFKEVMNEVIRPATKLYFEVASNVYNLITDNYDSSEPLDYGFDTNSAPVSTPTAAVNERYYAVLGDDSPVGDPNRICADVKVEGEWLNVPYNFAPMGVTYYTAANTECLIGDNSPYDSFYGFDTPVTFCFKGHIPTQIRIERYDSTTSSWVTETTIDNSELNEYIEYTPDYDYAGEARRFLVKNTESAGRFQMLWVRNDESERGYIGIPSYSPIVFENSYISSVNISEETDLTSQTLPTYDMTVECLDPDELFTPDTDYWKYQFNEGSTCYFKVGYDIDGHTEYLPMFFGKLTKAPDYERGKITFSVAVDFSGGSVNLDSIVNRNLNAGDIVDSRLFKDFIESYAGGSLFRSYDVFHGDDDIQGSECNYYGSLDMDEARQLIANALGSYITPGINAFDLHNTNDIQYQNPIDTLTRYDQVKNTRESREKVGNIVITRNENTLSANGTQLTTPSRVYIRPDAPKEIIYKLPFRGVGKYVVNNYQKSVAAAVVVVDYSWINEYIDEDGYSSAGVVFTPDRNTYIQPIITFYGVDNNKFENTTRIGDGNETYTNDNVLITNGHTASKAERVAHIINDISNQYEVDVVQDFRYEPGDTIRLETEKGVFKTCVITGTKFALPGSNGHITCRKIFSFFDSRYSVEPIWRELNFNGNEYTFALLEDVEATTTPCVIAYQRTYLDDGNYHMVVINLGGYCYAGYNDWERSTITDNNAHEWKYEYTSAITEEPPEATFPILHLPDYDYRTASTSDYVLYGVVGALKELYKEQGMVAPIDYPVDENE